MSSRKAVLKIYKHLLRTGKQLHEGINLRAPIDCEWGTYGYAKTGLAYQADVLQKILPSLSYYPGAEVITPEVFRTAVRENFKRHKDEANPSVVGERLDEAFQALRAVLQQQYLAKCSSSCNTEGVQVDVTSAFSRVARHMMGHEAYVFTYRVRVANTRSEPVQILGRSWTIKNELGDTLVHIPLERNAVVGQQPVIPPGECFEYCSGTDVNTPSGLQNGQLLVKVLSSGKKKASGEGSSAGAEASVASADASNSSSGEASSSSGSGDGGASSGGDSSSGGSSGGSKEICAVVAPFPLLSPKGARHQHSDDD